MTDITTLATRGLIAVATGCLTAAAVFSVFAVERSEAEPQPSPSPSVQNYSSEEQLTDPFQGMSLAADGFPTNSSGQTYGSDAEAESPEDGPDLVAVVGDRGIGGFVYASELAGPDLETPDEVVAWQRQQSRQTAPDSLPVYDLEGKKQVDTFTLGEAQTTTDDTEAP